MPVLVASAPSTATRLQFLDALRGFAALYVVAFHTAEVPRPALAIPAWLAPWLENGGTGVTLFFLISAFTLCLTLDGRQHRPHAARDFYVRRFFRIAPLYYLWLVAMAFWAWGPAVMAKEAKALSLYAGFGYNFFPHYQFGLVMASWTLGVEMVFYAAFPLLFKFVTSPRRAALFLLLALFVAVLHWAAAIHAGLPTRGYVINVSIFHQLPVFALGMVMYYVYKALPAEPLPQAWRRGVLLTGAALFVGLPYFINGHDGIFFIYLMALVYAVLFFGLYLCPVPAVVNRASVFVGIVSYSLYLNHPPVIIFLGNMYARIYAWPLGTFGSLLACIALTIALLVPAAYVTYKLVELPFQALGKRLIAALGKKRIIYDEA